MTVPFPSLLVVKTEHGWKFQSLGRSGGGGGAPSKPASNDHLNVDSIARTGLPDFQKFAHSTTAGWEWKDHLLAFVSIIGGREVLVVGAWWGARLVMDLERKAPFPDRKGMVEAAVKEFVLQSLKQNVEAWSERDEEPCYPFDNKEPLSDTWCYPTCYAHHAGILGLSEATEHLLKLEAINPPFRTSSTSSDFGFVDTYGIRRASQTALRRIDQARPRGYPCLRFGEPNKYSKNPETQEVLARLSSDSAFINDRHARVDQLRKGMPALDLAKLMGTPDYLGRAPFGNFWRYDIDSPKKVFFSRIKARGNPSESYTLLVWLSKEDKRIEKVVRFSPPFWSVEINGHFAHGGQQDGALVGSDGDTVYAYCSKLENDSFSGKKKNIII